MMLPSPSPKVIAPLRRETHRTGSHFVGAIRELHSQRFSLGSYEKPASWHVDCNAKSIAFIKRLLLELKGWGDEQTGKTAA